MRILTIIITAALLGLAQSSWAVSLQELEGAFAKLETVRAAFSMRRSFAGTQAKISSSGVLLVDRARGIALLQQQPFALELVATPDALSEKVGNDEPKVIRRDDNPAAFAMADGILKDVFGFSEERIKAHFNLSYEDMGDEGYRMSLTPKDSSFGDSGTVELQGKDFPEFLHYVSGTGDETALEFTDIKPNAALTHEELAYFN